MYTMKTARKRYRAERKAGTHHGMSFRQWARRTYGVWGASGKLHEIVRGAS